MKFFKNNMDDVLICLLEIVIGLMLLIEPIAFTSAIVIIFGGALLIGGIACTIKYFRTPAEDAAMGQMLTGGLALLISGAFLVIKAGWITELLDVLSVIYGLIVLFTGLKKVQFTIDLVRTGRKGWEFSAIVSGISVICAAVIIFNPFTIDIIMRFTGVYLFAKAALDVISMFIAAKIKEEE